MADEENTKETVETSVEPAEAFRICMEAFTALPLDLQGKIVRSIAVMLRQLMAATMQRSDEATVRPLGMAINVIEAMFRCTDRIIAVRRAEACVLIQQTTEIVLPEGNPLTVRLLQPLPGHGEVARRALQAVIHYIQSTVVAPAKNAKRIISVK